LVKIDGVLHITNVSLRTLQNLARKKLSNNFLLKIRLGNLNVLIRPKNLFVCSANPNYLSILGTNVDILHIPNKQD